MNEALAAIDEELDTLAEDRDLDAVIAGAHDTLPDRSEGLELVDALLENLGEAVEIPTVEPVGIDIPRPRMPTPLPLAEVAAVEEPATEEQPALLEEVEATPDEVSVAASEPPASMVEQARVADADLDDVVSDMPSETGLDADALFGDLDGEPAGDLASLFDEAEDEAPEPVEVAEAPPVSETQSRSKPPTMPPPPPVEALGEIEELDLDELVIEEDGFELMIDEDDIDAGDDVASEVAAMEASLKEAAAESGEGPAGGEGEGEDDAREQSFFKKLFG